MFTTVETKSTTNIEAAKNVAAAAASSTKLNSYWTERHFHPVKAYVETERSRDYDVVSLNDHVESQLPYLQWLCKIVLSKGIIIIIRVLLFFL